MGTEMGGEMGMRTEIWEGGGWEGDTEGTDTGFGNRARPTDMGGGEGTQIQGMGAWNRGGGNPRWGGSGEPPLLGQPYGGGGNPIM